MPQYITPEIMGAIIGAVSAFFGVLLGNLINIWSENRRAKREKLQAIRLRLVGDFVQTSEVLHFLEWQRETEGAFLKDRGRADLSRARLMGGDFRNQDLHGVIFYHASLKDANFFQANLQKCDFTSADLSKASLYEANAREAQFFRTNLYGAQLIRTELAGAEMVGVNLQEANLAGASLIGVDIRFANLEKANLSGTDLREVNLAESNLLGTILEGTNLEGAIYNSNTKWPDGFEPDSAGARFVAYSASTKALEGMKKDRKEI